MRGRFPLCLAFPGFDRWRINLFSQPLPALGLFSEVPPALGHL